MSKSKRIVLLFCCFIALFLVFVAAVFLLQSGKEVRALERRIAGQDRALQNEGERIRVLRAEWSALRDPERLERLMDEAEELGREGRE